MLDTLLSILLCTVFALVFWFSMYVNLSEDKYFDDIPTLKVVQSDSMFTKHEVNTYLTENNLNDQFDTFDLVLVYKAPAQEDLKLYGIVRVFVTVFTPIIDAEGNVTGYKMVCESLLGYCSEIYYSPQNRVPAFSTDTWKDTVGYETGSWWNKQAVEIEEHQSLTFDSYNLKYRNYDTIIMGDTLSQVLANQL